jgi:integrase/recombinase XerD
MTDIANLTCASSDAAAPLADRLRLAVAAYVARFKGSSREHTKSDLGCYLAWCAERGLDPLAAQRPHLELYIRWMQEIRRFKPSTVSRRFSVAAGFCRTCVIEGVLEHSPAEYVRRPAVPAESPTLGFTHLQFEAMLTTARESADDYDFALVAMLGLLGLRIFEATSARHRRSGRGTRPPSPARMRQGRQGRPCPAPTSSRPGHRPCRCVTTAGPILLNSPGTRMDRHAATRRLRQFAQHAGVRITRAAPVESARGAVPGLLPARF